MKLSRRSRRIALTAFILALVAIIATGFYRAATHQETRPATGPSASDQSTTP